MSDQKYSRVSTRPYVVRVERPEEMGIPEYVQSEKYFWECAGDKSEGMFVTSKECEIDFMWYLYETRKLLPGDAIKL